MSAPPHFPQTQNPFKGKQIIIDGGDASKTSQPLGPGGCRALATAIMGVGQGMPKHPETGSNLLYKPLQELRIWGANIGDDGASSIAELLRLGGAEIQLQYLELTNNEITEVGGFALGRSLSCMMNMSLITLALDYNMSFGSEGVAALCLGLRYEHHEERSDVLEMRQLRSYLSALIALV